MAFSPTPGWFRPLKAGATLGAGRYLYLAAARPQKPARVLVVKAVGVRQFERTRTVKEGVPGGSLLRY